MENGKIPYQINWLHVKVKVGEGMSFRAGSSPKSGLVAGYSTFAISETLIESEAF